MIRINMEAPDGNLATFSGKPRFNNLGIALKNILKLWRSEGDDLTLNQVDGARLRWSLGVEFSATNHRSRSRTLLFDLSDTGNSEAAGASLEGRCAEPA